MSETVTYEDEVAVKPALRVIFLRTPSDLVDEIDAFAAAEGFKTRTRAVFRLIRMGLTQYAHEHR